MVFPKDGIVTFWLKKDLATFKKATYYYQKIFCKTTLATFKKAYLVTPSKPEITNMRLEHVAQLATSRADWLWPNDVFGLKQNVNNKYQNLMVTRKVNLQPST